MKNKFYKSFFRTVAFILAVSMLLCLVSCRNSKPEKDEVAETKDPAQTNEFDLIPDENYDTEFKIAVVEDKLTEFFYEEDDATPASTVYKRNKAVEDKLGVKLSEVTFDRNGLLIDDFRKNVMAGDTEYNVAATYSYQSYSLITSKVVQNWMDVPNIDLTKPWWNKLSNDSLTIDGKLFTLVGDLSTSTLLNTFAIYMNINLAEDWGIDYKEIQQTVLDGKWTLDKFESLVSKVYRDTNGNGEKDLGDIYGLVTSANDSADVWQIAADNQITGRNSDGDPIVTLNSEKWVDLYNRIFELYYNSNGVYMDNETFAATDVFNKGRSVFCLAEFAETSGAFASMEDDYIILPYPKYSESQDMYYTSAMDEFSVMCLPITVEDTEMVGKVMEAMCIYSYYEVMPVYYDNALKTRYSHDLETRQIIDIIMQGRLFDLAFTWGVFVSDLPYMFRYMLYYESRTPVSDYQSKSNAIERAMKGVAHYYRTYE